MSDLAEVEAIYHAACERSPAEREGFLSSACGGDEKLRREVESLLQYEDVTSDLIVSPPDDIAADLFETAGKQDWAGKEIAHYQIISLLGAGGMGEVYLAEDTRLDRKAALKILPRQYAANKERMSRFIGEAKTASALNHPNIITIYEVGRSGETNFISTEFIEGKTLHSLTYSQLVDVETALEMSIQIAAALEAAHNAGIVHRDLKPENIMVRPDGLVKVLDFGIAKLSEATNGEYRDGGSMTTTKAGVVIGTASYMSPEQAAGKNVDSRSDIFSFGVVLYKILSGKQPFVGDTPVEIVSSVLKDEPEPLRGLVPDVPIEVEVILEKMLRKNAADRYQTAGELRAELKNARKSIDSKGVSGELSTGQKQYKTVDIQSEPTGTLQKTRLFTVAVASSIVLLIALAFGISSGLFSKNTAPLTKLDSIAVLPFQISGESQNAFLGDGIAETLINGFTKIPEIRVTARSTAFRYRSRSDDPQAVGTELGVKMVLTGKIAQQADRTSIQVDLINVADGSQIFGDRYEGSQGDLVILQDRIVRDIAERMSLSGAQQQQAAKKHTENSEAYDLYLRGRYHWNKRSAEDLRIAIQQFKQAIERDPNYALALVGLADSYVLLEEYAGTPAAETLPQAKALATRALEIDESLGEAHVSLGVINSQMWRWAEAESSFKRAFELNPNYPTAYLWYCTFLRDSGRRNESLAAIEKAQRLDPVSSIINVNVGIMRLATGDADAAIRELEKVIALDPNYWTAHSWLGLALLNKGRKEEAIAASKRGVQLSNNANRALAFYGYTNAVTGNRPEALKIVKSLEEKQSRHEATMLNIATVYAGLGDSNMTFSWLEKNLEPRSGESARFRWYPTFDSLRNDPRYKSLIDRGTP